MFVAALVALQVAQVLVDTSASVTSVCVLVATSIVASTGQQRKQKAGNAHAHAQAAHGAWREHIYGAVFICTVRLAHLAVRRCAHLAQVVRGQALRARHDAQIHALLLFDFLHVDVVAFADLLLIALIAP